MSDLQTDPVEHLQAGSADDPAHNPVLLPPRTRTDIVQDRPAGGTPAEVAAANPELVEVVPATVGKDPTVGADPASVAAIEGRTGDVTVASGSDAAGALTAHSAAETGGGPGPEAAGRIDSSTPEGAVGYPVDMGDGSGMEMPELAMQVGWTH